MIYLIKEHSQKYFKIWRMNFLLDRLKNTLEKSVGKINWSSDNYWYSQNTHIKRNKLQLKFHGKIY